MIKLSEHLAYTAPRDYAPPIDMLVLRHIAKICEDNAVSVKEKIRHYLVYDYYINRIFAVVSYGEKSGTELLKCICRCAFADEVLTEAESISIINICHSPEWHKIFMEVNYNEGWN